MDQSSGCFKSGLEWHSGMDDGPEDIHSAFCQGDDGCVVSFSFAALSVIEGATVVVAERAEGGLGERIRFRPLFPPFGLRRKRIRPDCRNTGAIPAAEARASAYRNGGSSP